MMEHFSGRSASSTLMATPSMKVVDVLEQYHRLPVEVISDLLGYTVSEIEEDIEPLEREGFIQRVGDVLSLSRKGKQPIG